MKAGYIIAILSGLLALVAACGGDDDDDGLPTGQIEELQRVAAELSDQAGFGVIVPTYVPSDLRFPPTQAEVTKDQYGTPTGNVTICFFSRLELRGLVSPRLNGLCIIEQEPGLGATSCPPQAQLDDEDEVLLSDDVRGVETFPEEIDRFHDLRFCAGETFVILKLDWEIAERTTAIDDHMRSEARRIAGSIIEQVGQS